MPNQEIVLRMFYLVVTTIKNINNVMHSIPLHPRRMCHSNKKFTFFNILFFTEHKS